jgi:hypothetical protein
VNLVAIREPLRAVSATQAAADHFGISTEDIMLKMTYGDQVRIFHQSWK